MSAARAAALEGALRRLLVDNTYWLDDAADNAKHHGENPEAEALCDAIEHARTVLDGTVMVPAARGTLAEKMARQGLDMPGKLQENSNPEAGRCWLETVTGDHVAEFNVDKVGPMESVLLAQALARFWNDALGGAS